MAIACPSTPLPACPTTVQRSSRPAGPRAGRGGRLRPGDRLRSVRPHRGRDRRLGLPGRVRRAGADAHRRVVDRGAPSLGTGHPRARVATRHGGDGGPDRGPLPDDRRARPGRRLRVGLGPGGGLGAGDVHQSPTRVAARLLGGGRGSPIRRPTLAPSIPTMRSASTPRGPTRSPPRTCSRRSTASSGPTGGGCGSGTRRTRSAPVRAAARSTRACCSTSRSGGRRNSACAISSTDGARCSSPCP